MPGDVIAQLLYHACARYTPAVFCEDIVSVHYGWKQGWKCVLEVDGIGASFKQMQNVNTI